MEPLLDEKDRQLEDALLRVGRDVQLSAAGKARVLAALGVSASLATSKAAAASGLLGKLLSGKGAALLVVSTVTVGVVGAGAYFGLRGPAQEGNTPEVLVVRAPQAEAPSNTPEISTAAGVASADQHGRPSEEPARGELEAAASEPAAQAEPARGEPAGNGRAVRSARKSLSPSETLGDELALVEAASRATKSGATSQALTQLAEYRRRFPRGKLVLEAEALQIEALARAGRTGEAARLAESFLKRHAQSPLAARIERYAK